MFCFSFSVSGQVKFIIESLPETTPTQDSIFITGTFNDWNTSDPKYLLQKQPNGQLVIELNILAPIAEYKFTRGDWLKVETGEQNEYIPNRIFVTNASSKVIPIRIQNWQDLGGARSFEYLIFYYFSIAFLAFILLIFSFRLLKKEPKRRQVFAGMHGLMVLLYLGAVVYFVVNPIWQAYLLILSQILIFVWGPVSYLFIKSIKHKRLTTFWGYFVPSILSALVAALRLMNLDMMAFFSVQIEGLLTWGKLLMIGIGGLITLMFLANSIKEEKWCRKIEIGSQSSFAFLTLIIHCICLSFLFISLYIESLGLPNESLEPYNWFFILFSFLVWMEVIALWRDPQFFKEKPQTFHIDQAEVLLTKLRQMMENEKVYHEAELSVNRLADLMDTKPHILSKLLNEHFEQNFRDYVNGYRVKEFIDLANKGKLEKLTYLGLAHEVGFNSKSTFNLAFKKMTNKSPRDYFKAYAL